MMASLHTALIGTLPTHVALSMSQLLTLEVLTAGRSQPRTMNLSHLASHCPGDTRHSSGDRHPTFSPAAVVDASVRARAIPTTQPTSR